jgi:hypothetical protein
MRTVCRQDNHFHIVILRGDIERVVQLVEHPGVLRVARLRFVQHDASDLFGWVFVENRCELFHRASC